MKKLLYTFLAISLIFSACEKEEDEEPTQLYVGLTYQGGIIFYLDGNGGGLIAVPYDQSTGAQWGCYGTLISGAEGIAIGTGNQNTLDIINANCTSSNGSPTAAAICTNLTLGGYSDWYLPSLLELNEMYWNRAAIGNFASNDYWSSTQSMCVLLEFFN